MISKVYVAYIVIALGVVPSLTANPIIPDEPAVNTTLAAGSVNAGHSSASTPAGNASASAASTTQPSHNPPEKASPDNATSSAKDVAANATSAAHPLTSSASNHSATATPQASDTNSTAATHDQKPESAAHGASTPKAPSTNNTASEDAHVKSMPVAKGGFDGRTGMPATPTCHSKNKSNGVEPHHCEKALEKVVYAANQTLDKFSSYIFANYKTCNVNIYKPKNSTLTKVQVGSMVHNITEACHSVGGVIFKTSDIVVKVERGKAENTYEIDTPICKKEQCPLTAGDCLSAFYQIPVDNKGGLTCKHNTHSIFRATSGNCTVTIATTDYSDIAISRQNAVPTMKKLLNECGRHPGKIYLPGGSTGFNGDLKISIRPTDEAHCE